MLYANILPTLLMSSAMLVGVMPTQLTYCVTFIGYQYISGWCSRQRHCVTDRAGSANQHTFHRHHTYQPAISDHLTPTDWTNHRPGLLSANDVSVIQVSISNFRQTSNAIILCSNCKVILFPATGLPLASCCPHHTTFVTDLRHPLSTCRQL